MSERIVHVIPNMQTKSMSGKLWVFMRVSALLIRLSSISVSLQLSALVQRVYNSFQPDFELY